MKSNYSLSARVDNRRRYVIRFALSGLSMRQIAKKLAEIDIVNPRNGEPYSHVTVYRDLLAVREQWQEEAKADMSVHAARQLGELRAARDWAWQKGDIEEVRKNIKTEMELLGTKAPDKVQHGGIVIEDVRVRLELPEKGSGGWELVDGGTES